MNTAKRLNVAVLAILALAPGGALAANPEIPRGRVMLSRRQATASPSLRVPGRVGSVLERSRAVPQDASAPRASYSVELPQISRVQGLAFYRTSVDITNNTTNGGVVARFQYSYTCLACTGGGFFRTQDRTVTLASLDNFHSDDFVDYLRTLGVLEPGAEAGSYGTLLVTFENLPSAVGWEGTVVARNYNRIVEADPAQGTVGYAYPASLFFESANDTVVATIRDTRPAPTIQGAQRTNLGIRNTAINDPLENVTVDVSFVDVTIPELATNGQRVGNIVTLNNLRPGEVQQISDVFTAAAIPTSVTTVIAFADVRSDEPADVTIEGYVNVIDQTTQDGSFFEMKCADADSTCGN